MRSIQHATLAQHSHLHHQSKPISIFLQVLSCAYCCAPQPVSLVKRPTPSINNKRLRRPTLCLAAFLQLPPGLAQQSALLHELIDTAAVTLVESDMVVRAVQTPVTQTSATWGLDRIDQPTLPLNGQYTYIDDATGVFAYILDTGELKQHGN